MLVLQPTKPTKIVVIDPPLSSCSVLLLPSRCLLNAAKLPYGEITELGQARGEAFVASLLSHKLNHSGLLVHSAAWLALP